MKLPKDLRDKSDVGGTVKTKKCSIVGCSENAIRSLSENAWKKYVEKAGLKFSDKASRRIFLCKEHYNRSNKVRKSQEKIFQKKGFLDDKKGNKRGRWDIS